jgi:hypothetical protein
MYIIVALSVVVVSMMFAVTVTIVYHIAKEDNTSSNGEKAASSRGGTDNVSSGSQAHVQATTQSPDKGTSHTKRRWSFKRDICCTPLLSLFMICKILKCR